MNQKAIDFIKSDLETSIDESKLNLIDRWTIVPIPEDKFVRFGIINECEGSRSIISDDFSGIDKVNTLYKLMNTFNIGNYCFIKDSKILSQNTTDKKSFVTTIGKDNIFKILVDTGETKDSIYTRSESYSDITLGVTAVDCSSTDDRFSVYYSERNPNQYIFFGTHSIGVTELVNYLSGHRTEPRYNISLIARPASDFSLIHNYGLEYLGNFMAPEMNGPANLAAYNEQRNKDFTKGYVACPIMLTTSGLLLHRDDEICIRRTRFNEYGNREVSNYLYML